MNPNLLKILQKIRWWPSSVILAAILWLTLAPHPVPDTGIHLFEGADKLVHGIMFFCLTLAVLYDIADYSNRLSWLKVTLAAVCVMAFGAFDEWAQETMNLGRTMDSLDFLADCIGTALAANLWLLLKR